MNVVSYEQRALEIINLAKMSNFEEDSAAILYYTLNFINYEIASNLCDIFVKSSDREYKNLGIICVGHLCRIYKKFPILEIIQNLEKEYSNTKSEYWGAIDDTLDDISIFLNIPKNDIFKVRD